MIVLDKKLINFKDPGELSKGSATSKTKISAAPTLVVKERKMLSSSNNRPIKSSNVLKS